MLEIDKSIDNTKNKLRRLKHQRRKLLKAIQDEKKEEGKEKWFRTNKGK